MVRGAVILGLAVCAWACTDTEGERSGTPDPRAASARAGPTKLEGPSTPSSPRPGAAPITAPEPSAATEAGADAGPPAQPGDAGETGTTGGAPESATESDEALVPDAPAPGTAEADAELLALLDESTLTQEEFDRAFGRGAPSAVAPPGERPEVRLGPGSGAATEPLAKLVEREQAKLVTCLGMALSKDASATGSLTLRATLDAKGEVSELSATARSIGGASEVGESLVGCLSSVVERWRLPASAGERVDIPLRLSTAPDL